MQQWTKTYVYDKLNRLIEIQPTVGNKTIYTYDLCGNRLTKSSDHFEFDLVNTSYSYDVKNNLTSVTKGTELTTMEYYADGLRAEKTTAADFALKATVATGSALEVMAVSGSALEATVASGPALKAAVYGTTLYVNDLSGHLMAEAQNSPNVTANYVWGPDRVLAKKEVSGGEYYYLYIGHGDVIQIVDRNGNVVNNYQYDEWGNNPLSLNLYSYCYNNPLLFTDSSGNTPWTLDPEKREAYSEAVKAVIKAVLTGLTVLFVGDSHPKNEKKVYQTSNTVVATPCPAPPNPNNGNNRNKKDKEDSDTKHKIGENGTKTTSETVGQNGKTERVDVENPKPGQRDGQIHYHDQNNNKYIYDIANKVLVNEKMGEVAAKSVQKVLSEPWVKKAIEKGLKYLGE